MNTAAALADRMGAKPAGAGWLARCPAHPDDRASLSIGTGQDGRVLLNCHAGCAKESVLSALGLTFSDLQVTRAAPKPEVMATYSYADEHGTVLYEVQRLQPKGFRQRRPDGAGGWIWSLGDTRRVLYRLPDLHGKATVFVAEGEKDVDRLREIGLPATCNSGGAGKWREDYSRQLATQGVKAVVILPDNDDPGRQHAETVARSVHAAGLRVKVLALPDLPAKGDVSDYLAAHSKEDLLALVKSARGWSPSVPANSEAPASAEEYVFVPAFAADHFVGAYGEYARQRTDAALEYHEALGLALLAAATPNVRAFIGPYPNGIAANLYLLLGGDSTVSRKSSAIDTAKDIQERAIAGSILPESMTPEAMVEALAKRSHKSSTLHVDEFTEFLMKLEKQAYMAGMRGMLLMLYAGNNYTAQRRSKASSGQKSDDADIIERPHLSVIGASTPSLFQRLAADDVTSGLLPRFAVVWPRLRPARRPFYEVSGNVEASRDDLVNWLKAIHGWASAAERRVRFEDDALVALDSFSVDVERDAATGGDEVSKVMLQRLVPMGLKLAMLSAVGRLGAIDGHTLLVRNVDAHASLKVLERWKGFTQWFSSEVGQNDFERRVGRCLRTLTLLGGRVKRSEVAKRCHMAKREMDAVEDTLQDRGEIEVIVEPASSGPASRLWMRTAQ